MDDGNTHTCDLTGRVALITGGSSGIGREIALAYVRHGAKVVVADLQRDARDADTATVDAVNELRSGHGVFVECDVTDRGQVDQAVQAAEEIGGLDVLVNNAGIFRQHDFLEVGEEAFDQMMGINVKAAFFVAQAAARRMVPRKRGVILNLSSVAGLQGTGGFTTYCATKGAVRLFTMALAQELAPHGVRVNAIHPGLIDTSMTRQDVPIAGHEMGEGFLQMIPMNRFGTPEEVADTALYLASDLSRYVTGASMVVDGGLLRI